MNAKILKTELDVQIAKSLIYVIDDMLAKISPSSEEMDYLDMTQNLVLDLESRIKQIEKGLEELEIDSSIVDVYNAALKCKQENIS